MTEMALPRGALAVLSASVVSLNGFSTNTACANVSFPL